MLAMTRLRFRFIGWIVLLDWYHNVPLLLEAGDPSAIASDLFLLLVRDLPLRLVLRVTDPPKLEEIDRRARAATAALLHLHGKAQS
jgi:hypothetical protein